MLYYTILYGILAERRAADTGPVPMGRASGVPEGHRLLPGVGAPRGDKIQDLGVSRFRSLRCYVC